MQQNPNVHLSKNPNEPATIQTAIPVNNANNTEIFNELKKVREELIRSEEERIQLTQHLAAMKIKYDQVREMTSNNQFDPTDKLDHIDNDIEETNKIMQTVQDLHNKLRALSDERNSMEEEMYHLKQKNERFEEDYEKLKLEFQNYKVNTDNDVYSIRENLNSTKNENEFLRNENDKIKKLHSDLAAQLDEKEIQYKKQLEDREREIEMKLIDKYENEKRQLEGSIREANRKLETIAEENSDYNKIIDEIRKENNKTNLMNSELRQQLREYMARYIKDKESERVNIGGVMVDPNSKVKLIKTYTERETELLEQIGLEKSKIENLKAKIKKIRTYARKVRNIALDFFPVNEPLPEVLTKDINIFMEDAENESVIQFLEFELKTLRERNKKLEFENNRIKDEYNLRGKMPKTRQYDNYHEPEKNTKQKNDIEMEGQKIQKRILDEIEKLKNDRPATSSKAVEKLKEERDDLAEEVRKLKKYINDNALAKEDPNEDNPKFLKQKIVFLQQTVEGLEKERSELTVKATMAEEQVKQYQEYINTSSMEYQKKIVELSNRLEAASIRNLNREKLSGIVEEDDY